ncbi:MAG TPA: plastocyanin/azurin family copper-binding protein [Roseomonas sp.]|nr:plastocyanin/azurin family copper-binding protein [Roseomonas sp.]
MLTRRHLAGAGGLLLAGLGIRAASAEAGVVEIRMIGDEEGGHVGFDPIGLFLQPGQTVRWRCEANYHTTTAYHPANGDHSLRIPRSAKPWGSEVLLPGESFQVTLTVEGVYDYFCAPHEQAGMVGRLIVGKPIGPGSMPFDWFKGSMEGRNWSGVPPEARAAFPSITDIMARKAVPARGL